MVKYHNSALNGQISNGVLKAWRFYRTLAVLRGVTDRRGGRGEGQV